MIENVVSNQFTFVKKYISAYWSTMTSEQFWLKSTQKVMQNKKQHGYSIRICKLLINHLQVSLYFLCTFKSELFLSHSAGIGTDVFFNKSKLILYRIINFLNSLGHFFPEKKSLCLRNTFESELLWSCSTWGPRIARKFVPKFLRAIQNDTVWIYTSMRAKNYAIARNRTNFTLKLNILGPKN